jgi:RNA polymerase sigma-70 factor, ECF subfamily
LIFKRNISFDPKDNNSVIQACLKGERRAQQSLVEQFLPYGKSICLLYSKDVMDIDEMVNDGFIRVFSNLAKFDHSRPFKSWFRAVFINSCIDHYRKNKAFQHTLPVEDIIEYDTNTNVIDEMAAEELLALVSQLTPVYRMVFTLYVVEGYNHREIGDLLGIQEGTSKSNLRDARKKLQQMIHDQYGNHFYSLKIIRS